MPAYVVITGEQFRLQSMACVDEVYAACKNSIRRQLAIPLKDSNAYCARAFSASY